MAYSNVRIVSKGLSFLDLVGFEISACLMLFPKMSFNSADSCDKYDGLLWASCCAACSNGCASFTADKIGSCMLFVVILYESKSCFENLTSPS